MITSERISESGTGASDRHDLGLPPKSLREQVNTGVGILALVAVSIWAIYLIWMLKSYTLDDSFITWRYGENLVQHGTWNFNPSGPKVEAYSSFLYALISYSGSSISARSARGRVGSRLRTEIIMTTSSRTWDSLFPAPCSPSSLFKR